MADSPVSVHQGSGTLAQAVLSSAPEGMLIAPAWKRSAAYMLDVVLLTLVLHFLTGQSLLYYLMSYSLVAEGGRYLAGFVVNWILFFSAHYLYFKTQAVRLDARLHNVDSELQLSTITGHYWRGTTGVLAPLVNSSTSFQWLAYCGSVCETSSVAVQKVPNTGLLWMSETIPLLQSIGPCHLRLDYAFVK